MKEGQWAFTNPPGVLPGLFHKFGGILHKWTADVAPVKKVYRELLHFGYDAAITVTAETITVDAAQVDGSSNTYGYGMIHNGKVVGLSAHLNVTEAEGTGTLSITVQKDAVNQLMVVNPDITGISQDVGGETTDNQFSFADGEAIGVEISVTGIGGPTTVDDIAILVEIEVDAEEI